MIRGECAELAPLRSAWVDGGLSPADTDRLMRHLAGCPACVRDLRELCRVRDLLNDIPGTTTTAPPAALAERLVRIAGVEAREPLWMRPFRRTRVGVLPSRRRRRRRRLTGAAAATVTLVTAVSVVGYAAAPASALAELPDPTTATRAEFSATLSELPLGNDALASVLMVRSDALRSTTAVTATPTAGGSTGSMSAESGRLPLLDEKDALALLARAETVGTQLSYSGEQQVQVALTGGSIQAEVDLTHRAASGTDVVVHDTGGTRVMTTRVPAPAGTRGDDEDDVLKLIRTGYQLTGSPNATLLGRPATVVDARTPQGELAARWWVDTATGLLLRQEVYDGDQLQVAAGFTRLQLGTPSAVEHGAAQLAISQTTSTLLLSNAQTLAGSGWACRPTLDGLDLIWLRSDSASSPGVLHMVYSDGLRTLSVFERRGELTRAPAGTTWDAGLHAYVSTGFPASASWQSGSSVFTVVTDGRSDLVTTAVSSLPHDPLPRATTMARIKAGWARILHLSSG